MDVGEIFEWLVAGTPGAPTPAHVVARIGPDLRRLGMPLDRVEAFVRTLHPHIAGRSFLWTPGTGVEVRENTFAFLGSPAFTTSPAAEVCRTGKAVHLRLDAGPVCDALTDLVRDAYTDYFAGPLTFLSGQTHALTFATKDPGGFTAEHVTAIERILPPLSRVAEIFALSRTATNLLNTYVGRNAGERILAGHIQRGDTDSIRAVIWFSDLRGFTTLAGAVEPNILIRVLNELFECQVPAIERRGGEVLKFMGDGLLAIFPIGEGGRSIEELCDLALDAAGDAFAALASLNDSRVAAGDAAIRFGLAFHFGDIAYGNIGGSGRLDFTCIGPAVNLASRLEGLTGRLDRRLLLSEEFAHRTTRPVEEIGTFDLKGVAEPQRVFAPVVSAP